MGDTSEDKEEAGKNMERQRKRVENAAVQPE